jgi:hypothetical protein
LKTTAGRRKPVKLLNKVDFPVLGCPKIPIVTVGLNWSSFPLLPAKRSLMTVAAISMRFRPVAVIQIHFLK